VTTAIPWPGRRKNNNKRGALQPAELATVSIVGWLVGGAIMIAYGLLTGAIRSDGILRDRATGEITPDRMQLLVLTLGGAISYVIDALDHLGDSRLPEISTPLLATFGVSQLFFLIPKFLRQQRST
jgi:hypothetical protein